MSVRRGYAMPHVHAPDWPATTERSHAVQFYETDGQLLDVLTRFVGTALVSGDGALVIATKAHRDGLGKRLKANGLDIRVPCEQGRCIAVDAATTLEQISANGAIDPQLFQEIVGQFLDSIDDACRAGERRRVVAFAETVALLWGQGRCGSALQLEHHWNDVPARHHFSLCCGYPMQSFGNRHAASFMKICAQHSHVFPAPRGHRLPAVAISS